MKITKGESFIAFCNNCYYTLYRSERGFHLIKFSIDDRILESSLYKELKEAKKTVKVDWLEYE